MSVKKGCKSVKKGIKSVKVEFNKIIHPYDLKLYFSYKCKKFSVKVVNYFINPHQYIYKTNKSG